ncbi:DUF2092 domain-containing protein [Streptomyces sp. NPDC093085]|uniref:LolA family protein n=1 Tax=Streptomyces sp. NPDC093085 TaxID=3155068 RepID=UPI0034486E57
MAPNDNGPATEEETGPGTVRRKAARYALPVAVAGVAAATIGLVPALAATGDPDLPKVSAQQLIEKIAASDTEQLSGTVKITTDLGIPGLDQLGSLADSFVKQQKESGRGGEGAAAVDPSEKLMELAAGSHTLRVAVDGPDKQRLSILDKTAEYSVIHNGGEVWAYDSGSNTAYHATEPTDGTHRSQGSEDEEGTHGKEGTLPDGSAATPKAFAEEVLKAADETTSVTVDGTARVAGRDAYRLLIKPKQSGSTVGSIAIAVDAKTGTPLKFTLSPSSGGKAVVDAGFTKVDFGKPAASTFDFTPPKGAKVTEESDIKAEYSEHSEHSGKAGKSGQQEKEALPGAAGTPDGLGFFAGGIGEGKDGAKVIGKGWNAVYVLSSSEGEGLAGEAKGDAAKNGAAKGGSDAKASGELPAEAQQFVDALGDKVTGKFGTGTVFQTRIVNALTTDDGTVYVGTVTKDALLKAANQDN